jgi:predicted ABC-type ATPase
VSRRREPPSITVFAGTNGAGKSSIIGATLIERGGTFYDPDAAARRIRAATLDLSVTESNALAWAEGRYQLERAIDLRQDYTFETTLDGTTIPALLAEAAASGLAVRIWYAGLSSPEMHVERVRARVAAGGHDIPEAKIREGYDSSRENLIQLLPSLTGLWLYDNSAEGDPNRGISPEPFLILRVEDGGIREACDLADVPTWAKPIFIAALQRFDF